MSATPREVICIHCTRTSVARVSRTFLGFGRFTCALCGRDALLPLSRAYQATYSIILGLLVLAFIGALQNGKIMFPGLPGIGVIWALVKDRGVRQRFDQARAEQPIGTLSVQA